MSQYKIGQYVNLEGIKLSLRYIFRLKTLKPDIRAKSLCEINLEELKNKHNIKYIVFDKDNTLTIPHKNDIANKDIGERVNEFKFVFGVGNLGILSNTAGSKDDTEYKEAKIVENNFVIQVIKHEFKKPMVYNEILHHFNVKNETGKQLNKEICIIGDRLLVDIIMGKEYGFFTILVDPISDKDNIFVRSIRRIENIIINL